MNRKPLRIKTGDDVIVISGEDKGKAPRKVLSVLPKQRQSHRRRRQRDERSQEAKRRHGASVGH